MTETATFRVDEEFAHLLLSSDEGTRRGAVGLIAIDTSDPRFTKIGELQKELRRTHGRPFFYGWDVIRTLILYPPCLCVSVASEPDGE